MTNAYETLYQEMKDRFTVVKGENEYTLGAYMRMKAQEMREMTVAPIESEKPSAKKFDLRSFFEKLKEKFALKEAPSAEKTIKAFPIRTSASALCAAVLLCTVLFTYGFMNDRASVLELSHAPFTVQETQKTESTETLAKTTAPNE